MASPLLLAVPLVLAALSCSPVASVEPPTSVPLGEVFPLRVGEQARVEGESLVVSLVEVVEDSRCPREVVCVWEGNARLRLILGDPAAGSEAAEVNTTLSPTTASAFGYLVELDRLEPDPPPEGGVEQDSYVAHLRVSRPD